MKRKRHVCSTTSLHCYDPTDRISGLPDEILLLILSSLPLKQSIVTSLLARRWRFLYASLPRLTFDPSILHDNNNTATHHDDKQISQFARRVKNLLGCYKSGHNVEQFTLRFCLRKKHTKFVDACVKFALLRNVESLELDFFREYGSKRIKSYSFQFDCFKSLRSLRLATVVMDEGVLEGVLANCPVLETLTLHDVSNLRYVKVVGPSLRLKKLEMIECRGLEGIEICDVPIVSMTRWRCEQAGGSIAMKVDRVPHLVELFLTTSFDAVDEVPLFASCVSQLESLKLYLFGAFRNKQLVKPMDQRFLSMVSGLVKLREVDLMCLLPSFVVRATPLIEALPHLHKIVMRVYLTGHLPRGSRELKQVERRVGVLEHLKVLEFAGYRGGPDEDEFISYIAKNAAALKTVIIDTKCQSEPPGLGPTNRGMTVGETEESARINAKHWVGGLIPSRVKLVVR